MLRLRAALDNARGEEKELEGQDEEIVSSNLPITIRCEISTYRSTWSDKLHLICIVGE
jgi:hypothetical protein